MADPEDALIAAAMTPAPKLSKRKHKQLRSQVRKASPAPWRFTPPVSTPSQPDRDRSKGITGTISFGEVASGSGAFNKVAQTLDMRCEWFIEPDPETTPMAAAVAGPQAAHHKSVVGLHPLDLPEVDAIIAGPECTPFSAAGFQNGFVDKRSKTLLWVLWYACLRQPKFCFIENVSAIQGMQGGDVWRTLVSLFDAAGYHLHHQHF